MTLFGQHPVDEDLLGYVRDLRDELIHESGATTSDWNERLRVYDFKDAKGDVQPRSLAYSDGTIGLRTDLMDALREMWQRRNSEFADRRSESSNARGRGRQVSRSEPARSSAAALTSGSERRAASRTAFSAGPSSCSRAATCHVGEPDPLSSSDLRIPGPHLVVGAALRPVAIERELVPDRFPHGSLAARPLWGDLMPQPEDPAPVRAAATLASTGQPRPRRTVSPSQRRASRGDRTIER